MTIMVNAYYDHKTNIMIIHGDGIYYGMISARKMWVVVMISWTRQQRRFLNN